MKIANFDNISILVDELYDEKEYFSKFNTPEVLQGTSLEYPLEEKELDSEKLHVAQGEKRFILHDGQEIVGAADIYEMDEGQAKLRYWVAKKFWGKGIASRAVDKITSYCFEGLKLNRVYALVDDTNAGSRRVLEKSGFTREKHTKPDEYLFSKYS